MKLTELSEVVESDKPFVRDEMMVQHDYEGFIFFGALAFSMPGSAFDAVNASAGEQD